MNTILKKDTGAKFISDTLCTNGCSAYLVGGCVRDACMGEAPCDIDITTSAPPETVLKILESAGCKVVPTGIKHGTVTAIYNKVAYEITTMRKETGYNDKRHPEKVEFVSDIESDLARRDFTVNAMAYSYEADSIIDIFGGIEDIKAGLIRSVGEPKRRFDEDALRILRALRFASKLGFSIEENTLSAMRAARDSVSLISAERVYKELCGILCGKHAGEVIRRYFDILTPVIFELKACSGFCQHSRYHEYDVLEHICAVIDATPQNPTMRLAALFHDIGKPCTFSLDEQGEGHFFGHAHKSAEIADDVLTRLKADNKTKEQVLYLVKHHDTPLPKEIPLIKKRLNRIGKEKFEMLCDIAYADCMGQSDSVRYRLSEIESIKKTAHKVISDGECLSLSSLAVDGHDVMLLGVKEGREVGYVLQALLEEVLTCKLENTKQELLKRTKELLLGIRD